MESDHYSLEGSLTTKCVVHTEHTSHVLCVAAGAGRWMAVLSGEGEESKVRPSREGAWCNAHHTPLMSHFA